MLRAGHLIEHHLGACIIDVGVQRGHQRGVYRYSGHDILTEQGRDFWGLVSIKQLMPETADIFPFALLCVFPARVLLFVKALGTEKKSDWLNSNLN